MIRKSIACFEKFEKNRQKEKKTGIMKKTEEQTQEV
jgi:hypothetical protein